MGIFRWIEVIVILFLMLLPTHLCPPLVVCFSNCSVDQDQISQIFAWGRGNVIGAGKRCGRSLSWCNKQQASRWRAVETRSRHGYSWMCIRDPKVGALSSLVLDDSKWSLEPKKVSSIATISHHIPSSPHKLWNPLVSSNQLMYPSVSTWF